MNRTKYCNLVDIFAFFVCYIFKCVELNRPNSPIPSLPRRRLFLRKCLAFRTQCWKSSNNWLSKFFFHAKARFSQTYTSNRLLNTSSSCSNGGKIAIKARSNYKSTATTSTISANQNIISDRSNFLWMELVKWFWIRNVHEGCHLDKCHLCNIT